MALSMFTTIPLPQVWEDDSAPLVMPCFPLAGVAAGLLWWGGVWAIGLLKLPVMLFAALFVLIPMLLTGCIHMDGYMDCSDAVFSRRSLEEKRRILKDSHVGAFAVISFGIWLMLSFAASNGFIERGINPMLLLFIPILSRAVSGLFMLITPPMHETGYAAYFKQNSKPIHLIILILTAAAVTTAGFLLGGLTFGLPLLCVIIGALLTLWFLYHQLKGISGDVCGCIIVVSELFGIISAVVFSIA